MGVGVWDGPSKYTPHFFLHANPSELLHITHTRRLCSSENKATGPSAQKVYSEQTLKTQCRKTLKKYIKQNNKKKFGGS